MAASRPAPTTPSVHYDFTLYAEAQRECDTILWRYLRIFYHDLLAQFDSIPKRRSLNTDGSDLVVSIICGSSTGDRADIVRRDIRQWARDGRRLRSIEDGVESAGCFFLVGDYNPDTMFEFSSFISSLHGLTLRLVGCSIFLLKASNSTLCCRNFATAALLKSARLVVPTISSIRFAKAF